MAKTKKAPLAEEQGIGAALKKQMESMRRPFMTFAQAFGPIFARREEIAARFMALYWKWRDAREKAGATRNDMAFVAFTRWFDSTIPLDVKGYKAHPAYAAADYLRRKQAQRPDNARQTARPSALAQLARAIATILPVVADAQVVWDACKSEYALSDRQLKALQVEVGRQKPILTLSHVKRVSARVMHVPVRAMQTARQTETPRRLAA